MAKVSLEIVNQEQNVRNPLVSVRAYIRSLGKQLTDDLSEMDKEYLDKPLEEVQRLETYISFQPWLMPLTAMKRNRWKAMDLLTRRIVSVTKLANYVFRLKYV